MTIDEIKAISIKDYLGSMSIYPTKNYSYYGMYKSPFRNEHTPSFKVDYNQNLWYDFALDEGGSLIDLVMYLQPIITQYFIDNKSEIWLLFLIAHSKR